jgi:hypothetical protein
MHLDGHLIFSVRQTLHVLAHLEAPAELLPDLLYVLNQR